MQCDVFTLDNKKSGSIDLDDAVFGVAVRPDILARMVNWQRAKKQAGTHKTKTISEIAGSTAKPWRQKGTGRARAGTIRSPIWVGGGRTFAAKPRDFSQKVNKKMYRAAMRSMLSELIRQERLVIVEELELEAPKTKLLAGKLKELDLSNVLILNEAFDEKLFLAARNLPDVGICDASSIDPVVLIRFEKVLITLPALKLIEERLS